ncbi:MAG: bifunctional folylpolyglutamate synthase/dihydrofolate synthase [Proteobacteria bacterium]|nr:bifunctional folylpolyglutamate synthase/dihydrofolate synthase [Pseudomonadota bacterium]
MANAPDFDPILDRLTRLHPKLIDLSLDRVFRLLGQLGNPHLALPPVVHVSGTNAKGSVIAMMRAALEAADYTVHVHTSPHLVRFNERIRLGGGGGGALIDDAALRALLEECEAANAGQPITFFEITTVAAMLAFSRMPADIVLLETGLGGRLDATNVIDDPALTIITPVSMDHQQFLGDTLAAIAGEKAGILKPGVPCVVAEQKPEALAAIEAKAAEIGARLLVEGRDWTRQGLPQLNLAGPHQVRNAGIAVAALGTLQGFTVSADALNKGFVNIDWPARLQRLDTGALAGILSPDQELWLDGGHNQAASVVLRDWIALGPEQPLHLVMGMLDSKDPEAFLTPLKDRLTSFRCVTIPGEPNSLSAEDLAARAATIGIAAKTAESVAAALAEIARDQPGPARVLITGSLYLAGKVLAENG